MKSLLIIQNHPIESPSAIGDYLEKQGHPFALVRAWEQEPFPDFRQIDAVICLGCPKGVRDIMTTPWLKTLFHFVSDCIRWNKPFLGICYGGQILAHALGATVTANRVKELGVYTVTLNDAGKSDPLFSGFPEQFPVFHWHGDTFAVPFDATLLAEGIDCKNQAFRRGKQIGVQFHLESESRDVSAWSSEYTDNLIGFSKTAQTIRDEFDAVKSEMRELNDLMIENFLREI
ncbi:MAG: type 1 glutamine amidotransferase [Candidatus Zixiibacteriota bacterium]